ncbi:MAG: hypothetical protein H6625_11190 [Bdellovibrionaceae bacterium]|nr:hypothetical protein [Pseudobdellovibrionaceae bacterium]
MAKDIDITNFYKNLGIENLSQILVPEVKVDPIDLLVSHWAQREKGSSNQKARVTNHKVDYIKKRVEFRNLKGIKVTGFLLTPVGPNLPRQLPTVIFHHQEGAPKKLGSEEIFSRDQTWQWAELLMNQGYMVLAIDSLDHGQRFHDEEVDYIKYWNLHRHQIQLLDDIQAYLFLRKTKSVGNIAILNVSTSTERSQRLQEALVSEEKLPLVQWSQSEWPNIDAYELVKKLNLHLLNSPHKPRLSNAFFLKMINQIQQKRIYGVHCNETLNNNSLSPEQGVLF